MMKEYLFIQAAQFTLYSKVMFEPDLSRKYCGNGVPDWAARPNEENFPYPLEVSTASLKNLRKTCFKIAIHLMNSSSSYSELDKRVLEKDIFAGSI